MDPQMQGGTQFSLESLMTPNFIYFVVTLAVIGYLYQTRLILGREQEVKSQSANLFDKQMYLEIGFMILIGFCMYIFNNNENTTFVWIYMLVPILYLVMKSLLVFNKVTNFLEQAPEHTDINTDIVDLINANKNNNAGQIPVTNQNSNTVLVTNRLNQAYGGNNNNNGGTMNPPLSVPPPAQFGNNSMGNNSMGNNPLEGFSLF
jgi:hypothetical protein